MLQLLAQPFAAALCIMRLLRVPRTCQQIWLMGAEFSLGSGSCCEVREKQPVALELLGDFAKVSCTPGCVSSWGLWSLPLLNLKH